MKPNKRSFVFTGLIVAAVGVALASGGLQTSKALKVLTAVSGVPAQSPEVASSEDSISRVAYRPMRLQTDKQAYSPGEVVIITSSGWQPGEVVAFTLREEPEVHPERTWTAFANSSGQSSGVTVEAAFGKPSVNLDQCANGPLGDQACLGANWQNGNVNANQAEYFEGDSIPYRDIFVSLTVGQTYSKTIEWDTTKSGKHAIDYLTTWNRSALSGSDPCSGTALTGCIDNAGAPTPTDTFPIPTDPNVTVSQLAGQFQCFGCDITAVSGYTLSGTYADSSATSITITFTATQTSAVLAWGGHISTRADWGLTNSAVNIPGSPYHTADIDFTCGLNNSGRCGTGKQDRSLAAEAVVFPGQITVIKDAIPDSPDDFAFSTTGGLSPSTFTLDDDATLPSPSATSNTQVFSNITTFTTYTITEDDPGSFTLTDLVCTDDVSHNPVGTADIPTRTATIPLVEGLFVTCTFSNSAPKCTSDAECSATPATPFCDESSGKCVQCTANSECSGATPICVLASHTCAPCTSDAQ
jgi:hypothetical protein